MTPVCYTLLTLVFFLLSLVTIFFQVSLYLSWDDIGVYQTWTDYSHKNQSESFFVANLICIVPLAYICTSSYFGLFKIKVHSFYALHSNQQTDPPCLVFSGMLLMRLAIAVAYNFLELSRVKQCAFFEVMGPLVKI